MKQKLLDYIDAHREALFALLCDMIDINTENDGKSGNEAPLANSSYSEEYEEISDATIDPEEEDQEGGDEE